MSIQIQMAGDMMSDQLIMNTKKKILTICGSTKANSTNSLILDMLQEFAASEFDFKQYDIGLLPFFNPDLDGEKIPQQVMNFLNQLAESDAVIICTPEYVFSLPGVLKNALEWTVSSSGFSKKPVALIVAATGGEKAFESLQLIMKTIEAKFDSSTTLLIQGAKAKVSHAETKEKLEKLFTALTANII